MSGIGPWQALHEFGTWHVGNPRAKLILTVIASGIANEDMQSYPSIKTMAVYAECSERSVSAWIKKLIEFGWLEVETQFSQKKGGRQWNNLYTLKHGRPLPEPACQRGGRSRQSSEANSFIEKAGILNSNTGSSSFTGGGCSPSFTPRDAAQASPLEGNIKTIEEEKNFPTGNAADAATLDAGSFDEEPTEEQIAACQEPEPEAEEPCVVPRFTPPEPNGKTNGHSVARKPGRPKREKPERPKREKPERAPEEKAAFDAIEKRWASDYAAFFGEPYKPDWGRDRKAIWALVGMKADIEFLSQSWRSAWLYAKVEPFTGAGRDSRFYCRLAGKSLESFERNYNGIRSEIRSLEAQVVNGSYKFDRSTGQIETLDKIHANKIAAIAAERAKAVASC